MDALRPLDGDSELMLKLGGSTVLEIGEGITSDGMDEDPPVDRPDELPSGRGDGSLGTEGMGE